MKKITVDSKLDVAYVTLRSGKVERTVQFSSAMVVDFDVKGRVLSIEFLSFAKATPAKVRKPNRMRRST